MSFKESWESLSSEERIVCMSNNWEDAQELIEDAKQQGFQINEDYIKKMLEEENDC